MKTFIFLLAAVLLASCGNANESKGEKHHKKRNNIINVKNELKEILTEDDVLIGSRARVYLLNNYLIIADHRSSDKQVHLFDKYNFEYQCSTAPIGQGPNEITNLGHIGINEREKKFYVSDHGKQKIFEYCLDSVLHNPEYTPGIKTEMNLVKFPSRYHYINDTLSYAILIKPVSASSFKQTTARWNIKTGEFKETEYHHPADNKKRVTFAVSPEHNTLVECNTRYDLISLYDLDGTLKCNVYGPNWDETGDYKRHFSHAIICGNKLVVSYNGEEWIKHTREKIIHIFSISGDYLKTLDVGRKINNFCYDEENNRLIMNLDDEYQFAYLDMEKYL